MSSLTLGQKAKFEKLFGMETGYVIDFFDKTFKEFFNEILDIDIENEKYNYNGTSKRKRLRAFWKLESNYNVSIVLKELLERWRDSKEDIEAREEKLYIECSEIIEILENITEVENIDAVENFSNEEDLIKLVEDIKTNIKNNKPEVIVDRLHTYLMSYVKYLCKKSYISYDKGKPLNSIFGEYVKWLKSIKLIKTEMTEIILKNSIGILSRFNNVRNNNSFAHYNTILDYDEALFIVNSILNLLNYIKKIEANISEEDRIPF